MSGTCYLCCIRAESLVSIAVTSIETPEPTDSKRDLNAFLVAMSVALHRHSMYPSDHPSIGPGVEDVLPDATLDIEQRPGGAHVVLRPT